MARKQLIKTNKFPYHITARSNNKEFFYLPISDIWNITEEVLYEAQNKFKIKIFQFVLMNNHYHLLLKTPQENIDKVMHYIQKTISNRINKNSKRINHVFGGPYKWSLITEDIYLHYVLKYIFQNPLRANIVSKCEEYAFSTLYHFDKNSHLSYHANFNDLIGYTSKEDLLSFFNNCFNNEQNKALKNSISRRSFKIARNQQTGKIPFKTCNASL